MTDTESQSTISDASVTTISNMKEIKALQLRLVVIGCRLLILIATDANMIVVFDKNFKRINSYFIMN